MLNITDFENERFTDITSFEGDCSDKVFTSCFFQRCNFTGVDCGSAVFD